MTPEQLQKINGLFRSLKRGTGLTQSEADALEAEWRPILLPASQTQEERFALCSPLGELTGVFSPRWLCHLLGLRHRAVEIGLLTQSGLLILQRRASTKADWPNALDMAVAGHVTERDSFERAAWKEIEEEIGLSETRKSEWLVEGELAALGEPYYSLDFEPTAAPPRLNSEVRQVFVGTLTGAALSSLRFTDAEADGLLLVSPEVAWQLLVSEKAASGMRYTLPRVLDWIEKVRVETRLDQAKPKGNPPA